MDSNYPAGMNLPLGTHGFPLPDIKTWNSHVRYIQELLEEKSHQTGLPVLPVPKLMGSIDDLTDVYCPRCGNELIRQLIERDKPFHGAVIYCWEGTQAQGHPQEYWVEVWPDAIDKEKLLIAKKWEKLLNEGTFKFSDPRVRRCYTGLDIWSHQHMSVHGYSENPTTNTLPKPAYIHKNLKKQ